jgi:hypothetical protein
MVGFSIVVEVYKNVLVAAMNPYIIFILAYHRPEDFQNSNSLVVTVHKN